MDISEPQRYANQVKYGPERKAQIIAVNQKRSRKNKDELWLYLQSHPCVDCGEDDPLVLEFDHIIPLNNAKVKRVASMVGNSGFKWRTILREIEKCEVVCANCHARRTAQQRNSWRWDLSQRLSRVIWSE